MVTSKREWLNLPGMRIEDLDGPIRQTNEETIPKVMDGTVGDSGKVSLVLNHRGFDGVVMSSPQKLDQLDPLCAAHRKEAVIRVK